MSGGGTHGKSKPPPLTLLKTGKVTACVGTKTEQIVKVVRDILAMSAGFTGIILQAVNQSFDPIALLVCALLLGVPLANLKALTNGESSTRESSSPSPPLPQQQQSTPPQLPPGSNQLNG